MRVTVFFACYLCVACGETMHGKQECEMCGVLVYLLEEMKASFDHEMKEEKAAHDAATAKRGVLGRTSRAEMPARVIDRFEEFLEKKACTPPQDDERGMLNRGGWSMTSRLICRHDGYDDSALRLPSGSPGLFSVDECKHRVDAVCENVARERADELIEAAYNNLTARACPDVVETDGCDAKRATKLLGPMYGRRALGGAPGMRSLHSVGVRDTWQKMPGRPPYYFNKARYRSQVEMPPGWDPDGPREQTIEVQDDEEEQQEGKDEL